MKGTPDSPQYSFENFCSKQKPLIELISLQKGEIWKGLTEQSKIMFVMQGKCRLNTNLYPEQIVEEEYALFLPMATHVDLQTMENSNVVIIRIDPFQKLNGGYSLEDLYEEKNTDAETKSYGILKIIPALKTYLEHLDTYIRDGFNTGYFFEIKIKELHLLLKRYYTNEELASFFQSVLNKDLEFASFVMNNWHKVKTAREFAKLSMYCETSFGKKFKKVFGVSPYHWLNEKRSSQIYYEIVNTHKPFKAIASEHLFNSPQHFNDYCLRYFKASPGRIRKSNGQLSKTSF